MLSRKLYLSQREWLKANQDEIISGLEKIGIRIDTSKPEDCNPYIICRDRKTLTIVCDATEY
jgi:hypothetical protein